MKITKLLIRSQHVIVSLVLSLFFIAVSCDKDEEVGDDNNDSPMPEVADTAVTTCPDANHPHTIDLGLPSGTKWACCNVGAHAPEEYGNYYAWGEVQTKSVYDDETYAYYNNSTGWVNIGSDIAGTQYDAATANWGGLWRMPFLEQCKELINSCSSEWTSQNGVYGRKFTGPSGGTVFLPAAGYRWNGELLYVGSSGNYWSSTLDESSQYGAYYLDFYSGYVYWSYGLNRFSGQSVRPVRKN